jgi:hypothetical protein
MLTAAVTSGDRAGLVAAIFIAAYLSNSLPAVIIGLASQHYRLHDTALMYSAAIAALVATAAAMTGLRLPRSCKPSSQSDRSATKERDTILIAPRRQAETLSAKQGHGPFRALRCLFGWAAEKVAGGVCVGHRVGVVDVEDQDKVERVGAGGQGRTRFTGTQPKAGTSVRSPWVTTRRASGSASRSPVKRRPKSGTSSKSCTASSTRGARPHRQGRTGVPGRPAAVNPVPQTGPQDPPRFHPVRHDRRSGRAQRSGHRERNPAR